VEHAQQHARRSGGVDEGLTGCRRRCEGLIGDDVDSAPDSLEDEFTPSLRRRRDGHGVYPGIEQLGERRENRHSRQVLMHFRHALRGARHNAGQFAPFRRLDERSVKVTTSDPVTNESDAHDASKFPDRMAPPYLLRQYNIYSGGWCDSGRTRTVQTGPGQ